MVSLWVIIIFLFFIALAACGFAVRNQKQLTALEHSLNQNVQALRRELDVVNSAAIGVGSHLIQMEKKLNGSIEKQQQLDVSSVDGSFYNQAISLAEHGANAAQIASKCGLPEAEASLMVLLKNKSTLNTAANSSHETEASSHSFHPDSNIRSL